MLSITPLLSAEDFNRRLSISKAVMIARLSVGCLLVFMNKGKVIKYEKSE